MKLKKTNNQMKVTLGGQMLKEETIITESKAKIQELTQNLVEKEEEITNLKNKVLNFENEQYTKNTLIDYLQAKLKNLEEKLEYYEKDDENNGSKLNRATINEAQQLKTIRNLNEELEKQSNKISIMEQNQNKFQREIYETDKVKLSYEQKIIDLNQRNSDLEMKVNKLDRILKQKEKYINILLKKNASDSNLMSVRKTDEKDSIKKSSSDKDKSKMSDEKQNINLSNVNNTILQNKIYELETTIDKQSEIIKKLEIDKQSLTTRMRNQPKK